MIHPCGYLSGSCFSKFRSFNHKFNTNSFVEGNLSFVEAPRQPFARSVSANYLNKSLSPPPFLWSKWSIVTFNNEHAE